MDDAQAAGLARAVAEAGLAGLPEPELLRAFCAGLEAAGVPVARALVMIDTLHPVHEGHVFRWRRDEAEVRPATEYGRINEGGEAAERWRRSPFHHLLDTGGFMLRRRLGPDDPADFPVLDDHRAEGQTDYLALVHRFPEGAVIGEMDGVYSSWATDEPGGFTDGQIERLTALVPSLALAVKSAALARIARTLVETYLGRDAGRRVLGGRIARGVAERIDAVLWYSDLAGFTRITEAAAPGEIIPFLNDYAEAVIASVHEAGGDVLKLVGDGTLAIFQADDPGTACRCALRAEALMRARVGALNEGRAARGLPVTGTYLGLHTGEVFYGNVGSRDRLDFTVVGPAVNEASRIVGLCRSVERTVLVSSAFAAAARPEERARLVSIGRYALKGVARPQELFTLDPG
ncbi:MAG TPA: adenylate/guanylate cyclase domain-containing protein [Beijerinckiaceae bacterium]